MKKLISSLPVGLTSMLSLAPMTQAASLISPNDAPVQQIERPDTITETPYRPQNMPIMAPPDQGQNPPILAPPEEIPQVGSQRTLRMTMMRAVNFVLGAAGLYIVISPTPPHKKFTGIIFVLGSFVVLNVAFAAVPPPYF